MTGLYNVRNYTRFGHLNPQSVTFGQLFKKAGYRTGIVGKWQLGGGFDQPTQFGFDDYCLWQLNRRPPRYANPGLEINGKHVDFNNGEYGPDLIMAHALEFIDRSKERPFFLYYPMMLTHDPFQPTPNSPDWDPKAKGEKINHDVKHFAGMTAYMDMLIGRLVAHLEKRNLRENTLILFLGDNGTGKAVTSRLGERTIQGGKGLTTSAGMHVPLIANWKGIVRADQVNQDLIDTTDILPTLCEAAGIKLDSKLDGRSYWPQLQGKNGNPRQWIYCWYSRDGTVKAAREFAATRHHKLYRTGEFYDFQADPGEMQPLTADAGVTTRQVLQRVLDEFKDARPKELR
jgi:arylsulfatase A